MGPILTAPEPTRGSQESAISQTYSCSSAKLLLFCGLHAGCGVVRTVPDQVAGYRSSKVHQTRARFVKIPTAGISVCLLCFWCMQCIFLDFGCQYHYNRLPGKTCLGNDLLCIEWYVKPYSLTHSLFTTQCIFTSRVCFSGNSPHPHTPDGAKLLIWLINMKALTDTSLDSASLINLTHSSQARPALQSPWPT